ncbi:MAG: MAPEG family protein [Acetobacteraceae bacterium]|nr:MAPEG family protein [Acetobacteraceae bacterium]
MTIAELCLPAMIVLIIATILPAKVLGRKEYDNANPRNPAFYTPGFRARSLGAHQNGMEAFPFFAAAVLLAEMRAGQQGTIDMLATGFVLARLVYVGCYMADKPAARSIVWAAGFALNLAIFVSPLSVGR